MHKTVYLSLGSNLGDRAANLREAIQKLADMGSVVAASSFYETEPVELTAQPWFLNCAVKLDTEKMPRQLISAILSLEQSMGRQRKQKTKPRTARRRALCRQKPIRCRRDRNRRRLEDQSRLSGCETRFSADRKTETLP